MPANNNLINSDQVIFVVAIYIGYYALWLSLSYNVFSTADTQVKFISEVRSTEKMKLAVENKIEICSFKHLLKGKETHDECKFKQLLTIYKPVGHSLILFIDYHV